MFNNSYGIVNDLLVDRLQLSTKHRCGSTSQLLASLWSFCLLSGDTIRMRLFHFGYFANSRQNAL